MLPTIEVLVRTHHRPKCFGRCIDSICDAEKDSGLRMLIHGIFDDPNDYESYGKDFVDKHTFVVANKSLEYPPNDYYRFAKRERDAWILHLDDDDLMCGDWKVVAANLGNTNAMILWKVWLAHKGVAVPKILGSYPVRKDTRGIGFLIHSLRWIPWEPRRAADVGVMRTLYGGSKRIWIDAILTKTQGRRGRCGKSGDY